MRTKLVLGLLVATTTLAIAGPDQPPPATPDADGSASPSQRSRPKPPSGVQLRSWSRMDHGPLGIAAIEISPELRSHLGAPRDRGVLVDAVHPDTLAAKAGVQVGDLIVEVDGAHITEAGDVIEALQKRRKGDVVVIDVIRKQAPVALRGTLEADPGRWPMVRGFGASGLFDLGPDAWPAMPGWDSEFDQIMRRQLEELRKRMKRLDKRAPGKLDAGDDA